MITCLERGANDLHMVQLMSLPPHHHFIKIQIGLTLLVPDYPGCPGKEILKRVSVFHYMPVKRFSSVIGK